MFAQLDDVYLQTSRRKAVTRALTHLLFEGRPLTTRARWLNPPTTAFLRAGAALTSPAKDLRPIFIVGTGRSGTTILGKVLSLHPELGFLNEPKLIWHLANPIDDLIGSYSSGEAQYALGAADATPEVSDRIRRLYGFYLRFVSSNRVLDKYPEMLFRTEYLKTLFPSARFILILRDGWDTVHSVNGYAQNNYELRGGELHDWWGRNGRKWKLLVAYAKLQVPLLQQSASDYLAMERSIDRAAVEWIVTAHEGYRLQEKDPQSLALIRYEDLCQNPAKTLTGLMAHCGLPYHDAPLGYAQKVLKKPQTRAPLPLDSNLNQPFKAMMDKAGYRSGSQT